MTTHSDKKGNQGMNGVNNHFTTDSSSPTTSPRTNKPMTSDKQHKHLAPDSVIWPAKGLINATEAKDLALIHLAIKQLLVGTLRGAIIGICLKATLNALFALLRGKKLQVVLSEALNKDTLSFASFLALFSGLFRFFNAILVKLRKEDSSTNANIAAVCASVSILVDSPERRKNMSLYLFSRAMFVLVKKYARLGVLPYIKYFQEFMFGVCNVPICYGFLYEPDILQKSYYNWIRSMGNVTESTLEYTFREVRNARIHDHKTLPFRPCQDQYHDGPCHQFIAKDYVLGLVRAAKIYLPVHLIPLILFRQKQLIANPVGTIFHFVQGYISSCFFLSTYVLCFRVVVCFGRNWFKADYGIFGVISGMLTGFATLFERENRVSELMLYCWPRSLEAMYNFLYKRNYVRSIRFWEVPMFGVAMSVLMSSVQADFKPMYHRLLSRVIGAEQENQSAKMHQVE